MKESMAAPAPAMDIDHTDSTISPAGQDIEKAVAAATSATTATTSSWISGLPPEIWSLVADQIVGWRTLSALVLTCRAFHGIFTPTLNRRFTIRLHESPGHRWNNKALPANETYLTYTRHLEVLAHEFLPHGYLSIYEDTYASYVAKAVKAMPRLRSFGWNNCSVENRYKPCLILWNKELLDSLNSHPTLRCQRIQFSSGWLEGEGDLNCFIPLKGFQNLTSLELYQFYGENSDLVPEIAQALRQSPKLKKLGLGKSYDFDYHAFREAMITRGDCDFLEKLCLLYSSLSGARPLSLKTLRLGYGMFLYKPKGESRNYLSKLVNLGGLEIFHVFNGVIMNDYDDGHRDMKLEMSLLKGCKSIRQLEVTCFHNDILQWLNEDGSTVEELIITRSFQAEDRDISNFHQLKLPHLTTLVVKEKRIPGPVDESAWEDIEDDTDDPEIHRLDPAHVTVLDRLHDRGSHLQRLSLCLNLEHQWERFRTHLQNMPELRQLHVGCRAFYPGKYPRAQYSLWPGVTKPKEIAFRYVQLMKWKCPSLQYVQLERWIWQLSAPSNLESLSESEVYDQITLRRLDFDEMVSMDLFSYAYFPEQAGLSSVKLVSQSKQAYSEEDLPRINELSSTDEDSDGGTDEGSDPDSNDDSGERSDEESEMDLEEDFDDMPSEGSNEDSDGMSEDDSASGGDAW